MSVSYPFALQAPPSGFQLPLQFLPLTRVATGRAPPGFVTKLQNPDPSPATNPQNSTNPTSLPSDPSSTNTTGLPTPTSSPLPALAAPPSSTESSSVAASLATSSQAAAPLSTDTAPLPFAASPSDDSNSNNGLPTVAKAGIALGCIAFVVLSLVMGVAWYKSRKTPKSQRERNRRNFVEEN